MKGFIKTYKNDNEERINYKLINREYDGDLIDYIVDCCRSLEALPNISFLGYKYVTNEAEIDVSQYINEKARDTGKKEAKDKRKITRYRHLDDSRYGELVLKFNIVCDGEEKEVTKKILVPVKDEKGYYLIKGTKYVLMYQIVDNSTYTTKDSMPLKSMMPVSIQVNVVTHTDTDGIDYDAPTYTILLFKKNMNILLFYLASMGMVGTLRYMSANKLIRFTDKDIHNEKTISFGVNSKLFLEVNKHFFDKYEYTRTIVFMLLEAMNNRTSMEQLEDCGYWTEMIGAYGTPVKMNQYEKGSSTLIFFNRLLDDTTKKVLKLHPIHKQNIYSVLRWMISHFKELRNKDNMDLANRRLRCNEYIAALLTRELGERVNRIISMGTKAKLEDIETIFKFPGDILISQLHRSGLLRFDDSINDMDFFSKLKVTLKGPNSIGAKSDNSVAAKYRGIHPSFIGRIDLNTCGTSDPGMSASLTPFCKTDGLYFDGDYEPEKFKYEYDKRVHDDLYEEEYVSPSYETLEDYFRASYFIEHVADNISINKFDKRTNIVLVPIFNVTIGDDTIILEDDDEDGEEIDEDFVGDGDDDSIDDESIDDSPPFDTDDD